MNLEILQIKNKLKNYLNDKRILDIIIFGSAVKGKAMPNDIDIAIICNEDIKIDINNFHISVLKSEDFLKPISIINTLFREGYSLKYNMPFSEVHKFSSKVLFRYELSGLNSSTKVKVVNFLRGKGNSSGIVKENKGEWLANQVFLIPITNEHIFEKFFINFNVKYKKFFILIH
ncbi:nucleotidyltransferase domain-containing protein [Candidatus Pacearchaeota archaeon]|nr:nucleotidyltransferase domain-containing protein [Candidatus Pacearchaeota archaeon]